MINISKKFEATLTKGDTSILKTGDKCFVGDDVEYTIKIVSSHNYETNIDTPMKLTGCTIEAKGLRMTSKTTVVQEYGTLEGGELSIIDEELGTVKFKPKDTMVECADKLLVQFTIVDSDERVSIQPFLLVLSDTIESGNVVIPTDDIRTLKNLTALINEAKLSLKTIELEMERVTLEIENGLVDMSEDITQESNRLSDRIEDLSHQIELIQVKIDNVNRAIIKQVSPTPFVKEGENTVSFKVPILGVEAKDIVGTTMLLNVSYSDITGKQGVCYSGQMGATCYKDSSNVSYTYLSLTPVYTPTVPGVSIVPSVVFNGVTNKIDSNSKYYEIWIKTNIPRDCITSAKCHIMSFGNKLGDDL